MEKLVIDLENCYGIRKLEAEFDFTKKSTFAVYSPNGTMKTSFAKSFMDLSKGNETSDLIFTERESVRTIKDENGSDIAPEAVFVIEPYNSSFKSDRLTTLLVNSELKDKYDEIYENISSKKDDLIIVLKPLTGMKKAIDESLAIAITHSPKDFFKAILRLKAEVQDGEEPVFGDIVYNKIFNDKAIAFLNTQDFKEKIAEYISKYDELIDSSRFFKKGVFNHNNATVIAKNLTSNGFFEAEHSIYLNLEGEKREVRTQAELEEVITQEKDAIINNPDLKTAFDAIDNKLGANNDLRNFREYLLDNLKILPELSNLERFKQILWVSYLKVSLDQYTILEEEFNKGKEQIEGIITEAKREETDWRNVIGIFNKRFSVPFHLSIENQEDVILKSDVPNIKFTFTEHDDNKVMDESDLLKVLSNGEKRALYILNIIFEVEARRKNALETLFIIDDIADSFDYKNKYAIVEYLKDISQYDNFYQIILSHNFDFFRTVCSRLDMGREHKLHTVKTDTGVSLIGEVYQNNPFLHWKTKMHENTSMLIGSIPFVRNLAEYSGDTNSFTKLTSLLHIKNDSNSIKISDLENIHKLILVDLQELTLPDPTKLVIDLIKEEAETISIDTNEVINLEGKVVLAIAIRLLAETHMISVINDTDFVDGITKNQTFNLYRKYKELHPEKTSEIELLEQVNLMTPENIHLNSFMYEPILDMGICELKKLFVDVKGLA